MSRRHKTHLRPNWLNIGLLVGLSVCWAGIVFGVVRSCQHAT